MKRLAVLCVVAVMTAVFAQTASAGRFGFKAGINLTSMDFKSGMPAALGYQAGITWQWNLPLGFAIQPDLLYHVKGAHLSDIKETFGLGYVELPINVQWGLRFVEKNVRLFLQASPFVGYAVAQTGSYDISSVDGVVVEGADKWNNINRFSYGAGLGLGVQLWAFQLTAQYNWNLGSLASISHASLSDFNNEHFGGYTISLALMFGKKKNK